MLIKAKVYPYDVCIIGGMGPLATAELFSRTVLYTDARADAEHVSLCVLNSPRIPDRSDFILSQEGYSTAKLSIPRITDKSDFFFSHESALTAGLTPPLSPLKAIKKEIRAAKKLHCHSFAVACNTAHCFYKVFEGVRGMKFINTVKETARYAALAYPDKRLCVLATLGTVKSDIYNTLSYGNSVFSYPSADTNEAIMSLIRKIKSGAMSVREDSAALLGRLCLEFDVKETVFILGCTELSVILPCFKELNVVDSTDVLAGCIISAGKKRFNRETFKLKTELF